MNDISTSSRKTNDLLILVLGLAGFVSAADNWFVSPSLSAIAAEFGVSAAMAGSILTAYMIPYGIMQPLYGFFSDRFSKVKLLRIIILGLAIGTTGSSLSNSLFVLCICRIFTGFFAAGIIAISISLIGDTVPKTDQQIFVGKFMGIVFAGQGLSAGLGGILTMYVSWRGAFIFFSIIAICVALLLTKLPQVPKYAHMANNNFFYELKLVLFSPKGKVIFPLALFTGFLLLGIYGYLGSFLHDRIHLDYLQSGIVIMFYGFACLIGGLIIGKLSNKIGKKNVVTVGEISALLAAVLLYLCYLYPCWQITLIATICLGLGYISVQSTLATIALDITADCKGLSSGLIGLGLFCGGGLGSMAGGLLLTQINYQAIWMCFGIALLLLILHTVKLNFD